MIVVLDVFESVLANFHFSSTVYCTYCSNRAPWGAAIDCSRNVQFHAVRSENAGFGSKVKLPSNCRMAIWSCLPNGLMQHMAKAPSLEKFKRPMESIQRSKLLALEWGERV